MADSDDPFDPLRGTKKRRLQGACDACRKRKIKCDRATKRNECTNCISFNILCTQDLGRGRRVKGQNTINGSDYVFRLEHRVKELEKLLPKGATESLDGSSARSASPEITTFKLSSHAYTGFEPLVAAIIEDEDHFFANTDAPTLRQTLVKLVYYLRSLRLGSSHSIINESHSVPNESDVSPEPDSTATRSRTKLVSAGIPHQYKWDMGNSTMLSEQLKSDYQESGPGMELVGVSAEMDPPTVDPVNRRFYGRSSETTMINLAFQLQSEVLGATQLAAQPSFKRAEFWQAIRFAESENDQAAQPVLVFPEPELMYSLIDIYFDEVNRFVPTLHKPTFLRLIAGGVHREDIMFGGLVLAACALGAAAGSDDPRVLEPGAPLPSARGLSYTRQILQIRKAMISPCRLWEIQLLCLTSTLLHVHCAGEGIYTFIGTAIRYMQEMGVHRMNGTSSTSVEGELWRRAFWTLVCMDRISAGMLGRPCCVQDEDFDLEWPRECDDEYWEDPINPWRQPSSKPSSVQFFTQFIKLCAIQGNTQRTIYANKKPRIFRNLKDEEWQRRVILELDSELNQFQAELPSHMRWDAKSTDPTTLEEAGPLHVYFHFVRIQIHRPFVLKQMNKATSLPLLISTNAAHSICDALHVLNQAGVVVNPVFQAAANGAGVMVLLNMWSCVRHRDPVDWTREKAFVDRLMDYMKFAESRWVIAGRVRDILNGLQWTPTGKIAVDHSLHRDPISTTSSFASSTQPIGITQRSISRSQFQQQGSHYSSSSSRGGSFQQTGSSSFAGGSGHASSGAGASEYRREIVPAASPSASSSSSSAQTRPSSSPMFDHRHLAPLHFSQPAYFVEQLPKTDVLPSTFGGLDEQESRYGYAANTRGWDLGAYNLVYPEYNQYSQNQGQVVEETHHQHRQYQHHQQQCRQQPPEQVSGNYYDDGGGQQGCYLGSSYEGYM